MEIRKWLVAGIMAGASAVAMAETQSFFQSASNLVVATAKVNGVPLVYVLDGQGANSCGEGFVLGQSGEPFTKESLAVLLTARTVNAGVQVGFDDVTCEIQMVWLANESEE